MKRGSKHFQCWMICGQLNALYIFYTELTDVNASASRDFLIQLFAVASREAFHDQ